MCVHLFLCIHWNAQNLPSGLLLACSEWSKAGVIKWWTAVSIRPEWFFHLDHGRQRAKHGGQENIAPSLLAVLSHLCLLVLPTSTTFQLLNRWAWCICVIHNKLLHVNFFLCSHWPEHRQCYAMRPIALQVGSVAVVPLTSIHCHTLPCPRTKGIVCFAILVLSSSYHSGMLCKWCKAALQKTIWEQQTRLDIQNIYSWL